MQKTIEMSKHEAVQLESQRQSEQEKMNAVNLYNKNIDIIWDVAFRIKL
jgi:hypothetical protein